MQPSLKEHQLKSPPLLKLYIKPKDLLLIQKFVLGMNGSKCRIVNGQIFEKVENHQIAVFPDNVYKTKKRL